MAGADAGRDHDLVARRDEPRLDDAQIGAGPPRVREAVDEVAVAHPDPELEARLARLRHLEHRTAHRPAVADRRTGQVDAGGRQVLAERRRAEFLAELLRPPAVVLERVRVDRLVGAAVDAAVGLVVAREVHICREHRPRDGRLEDRGLHRAPVPLHDPRFADVDRDDAGCHESPVSRISLTPCARSWQLRSRSCSSPRRVRRAAPTGPSTARERAHGRRPRACPRRSCSSATRSRQARAPSTATPTTRAARSGRAATSTHPGRRPTRSATTHPPPTATSSPGTSARRSTSSRAPARSSRTASRPRRPVAARPCAPRSSATGPPRRI